MMLGTNREFDDEDLLSSIDSAYTAAFEKICCDIN